MSSKWKGAYDSGRKYHKEWESEFLWLRKVDDGSDKAYCKYCGLTL